MRRRAIWTAIAALLMLMTFEVVWVSPAAQDALGIGGAQVTSTFEICGLHLRIKDAYANSAWTVITFSGMPPNVITGGVLLDQFGFQYPGDEAHNNNAGEIALGFRPANPLTALAGLRFTLIMTACDAESEQQRSVSVAHGSILFDKGKDVPAPAPGRLGDGDVTFESVRYGARTVSMTFQTRGIDVVGGFSSGEVSTLPKPGLDVQLVPSRGGPAQDMWLRHTVSGDTTEVRAMATLVDPGAYSLVLSIRGVGFLERSIMVG